MNDVLTDGRKLLVFHAIDDCNRKAPAIDAALFYPIKAEVEVLNKS